MVVKRHKIMGLGIIMIFILTACASTRSETDQFNIRFFTWGSLPFKKSIIEDVTHQKILFAIRKEAKSYSEIAREIAVSVDTIKESIVLLSRSDLVVAHEPSSDRWISNIPIFMKSDFERLLTMADKIAAKIHSDVIVPCNIELTDRAKEINLIHPFPDGALVRDLALRLLVDEGVLPEVPRPPVPWNFGVWGWEGQFLLWEEVTN